MMIGRELAPSHYGKVEEPGDPVIQMRSVDYHKESKHAGLSGVSLTVGRGEIVGIAGVDGNGQSQLAQVVTGVLTPDGGEVDMKVFSFNMSLMICCISSVGKRIFT